MIINRKVIGKKIHREFCPVWIAYAYEVAVSTDNEIDANRNELNSDLATKSAS